MGTTGRSGSSGATTAWACDFEFLGFELDAKTERVQCAVLRNGTDIRVRTRKTVEKMIAQGEAQGFSCRGLHQCLTEWPESA